MITAELSRRAQELAAARVAYVSATVVRAQRPTSVTAGNVALVLGDGTIEGFVGGACTEHSVRAYALLALQSGEPVLLRVVPEVPERPAVADHGAITVQNPCLSGGAIEVFLEPSLPVPRIRVLGETPIAAALTRLAPELGLEPVADGADLALVVAAHGRDELGALRAGLEAGLPYVGLVASARRGAGVLEELRADGVPDALLERIDVPAGLAIGARTPAEVALSILAQIVAVRRSEPAGTAAAPVAVDPICGMTVAVGAGTPAVRHGGATVHFCGEGCKTSFEAHAALAG